MRLVGYLKRNTSVAFVCRRYVGGRYATDFLCLRSACGGVSFCSEIRPSVHIMRYLPATDIVKYVYSGNLPGSVSDILPAVMPRAVVTEHPCWWLGGGTGFVPDIV